MNETTKYNGWSNRETWLASLWLTNDEVSYEVLKRAYKVGDCDYERADWLGLMDVLQTFITLFDASLTQ